MKFVLFALSFNFYFQPWIAMGEERFCLFFHLWFYKYDGKLRHAKINYI